MIAPWYDRVFFKSLQHLGLPHFIAVRDKTAKSDPDLFLSRHMVVLTFLTQRNGKCMRLKCPHQNWCFWDLWLYRKFFAAFPATAPNTNLPFNVVKHCCQSYCWPPYKTVATEHLGNLYWCRLWVQIIANISCDGWIKKVRRQKYC